MWRTEEVGTEEDWNKIVRNRIHEREQIKWRTQCLLRPKLRTYCKIKKDLRFEPYLDVYHRGGIPELVKIRGGTNRLRIEQGRYVKEDVHERVCKCCASGRVEDETHFMLECSFYNDLRDKMWFAFEDATGRGQASFSDNGSKLNALIGDLLQPSVSDRDKSSTARLVYCKVVRCVMTFITSATRFLLKCKGVSDPIEVAPTNYFLLLKFCRIEGQKVRFVVLWM